MSRNSNLRFLTIDKPARIDGNFAYYGRDALAEASKSLNGSAFKLWAYLFAQSPNVRWALLPSAIEREFGIPEESYRRGLKELKEKGYIYGNAIHMYPNHQNGGNEWTNLVDKIPQNDDTNNININNINNNGFFNINVEEAHNYEQELTSRYLDCILRDVKDWNWREHVDKNNILTTRLNHRIKVIFNDKKVNK